MILDQLFHQPQYTRPQVEKEQLLLPALVKLTQHHIDNCPTYAKIVRLTAPNFALAKALADLPYLPTNLFKTHSLRSVPEGDARITLTSSGTSGQAVSRIAVDDMTAKYQARGLSAVMHEATGNNRLPMLVIESEDILTSRGHMTARSAGVLGMMVFGHSTAFALDEQMQIKTIAIKEFLQKYGDQPFLIFGFTFMVWRYFLQALKGQDLDFSNATLIHSGGWKKMEDEAVDSAAFRKAFKDELRLGRIYNFYGMAEQIGTAFLEGDDSYFYPPAFGDVLIRDPETWQPLPNGQEGIIQTLSLLPHSYPGHSLLTEDRGVIIYTDAGKGGRMGKALKVLGRAPQSELRGCSDIHAFGAST